MKKNISSRIKATGQFIQRCREDMGISRQKLADLADVDATTIKRFEKGDQDIRLGTLIRICDAMGLKIVIREKQ